MRTRDDWDEFGSRGTRQGLVRARRDSTDLRLFLKEIFRFRSKTLYLPTRARGAFGGQVCSKRHFDNVTSDEAYIPMTQTGDIASLGICYQLCRPYL